MILYVASLKLAFLKACFFYQSAEYVHRVDMFSLFQYTVLWSFVPLC